MAYATDFTGNILSQLIDDVKVASSGSSAEKIKKVDDGVVPSTRKGRGSHININSAESISHTSASVNGKK